MTSHIDVNSPKDRGDRGPLVVPADWAVLDVLRFEGPSEEPQIQRLARGRPVEYANLFDSFRLTNPGDAQVKVRVVLIETIRLPARLRGRVIGSVKPYFSR